MLKNGIPVIVAALLLGSACKSVPPVQPQSDKSAAVGIEIELEPPLSIFGGIPAQTVYFVKVINGELKSKNGFIAATWSNKGRIYIFNADPGEYAAVAAEYKVTQQSQSNSAPVGSNVTVTVTTGGTSVYTTFLPRDAIEASRVRVEEGKLAYMGKFTFKMQKGFESADEFQKHYAEQMFPGSTTSSGFFSLKYCGSTRSKVSQTDGRPMFINGAKDDFGETLWSKLAVP